MAQTYTREEFVAYYGPYISQATKSTGILTGTVVAQAIIESQGKVNGSYRVGGSKLSREANNFFGIKCHNWTGKTYNINTGEQDESGNSYIESNACFRAYDSVEDSIDDYVQFLLNNSNYRNAGVFDADTVYEQAEALKRAGYATDVNYASKIGSIYDGVSVYVDKYSRYGIKSIWRSFKNSPSAFIKRNKSAFIGVGTLAVSLSLCVYLLVKHNRKK
jgi:flagellum-specific peptidoglycan hydrolase FlgJ